MSRMEKLNQLFKRDIGQLLLMGEVSDPRVKLVTITYADISKDLSVAHIGFSVLSDNPDDIRKAQDGLDSASGRVRKLMGDRVEIRHIPEIRFVYDKSIASGLEMARTLEEIRRERDGREAATKQDGETRHENGDYGQEDH